MHGDHVNQSKGGGGGQDKPRHPVLLASDGAFRASLFTVSSPIWRAMLWWIPSHLFHDNFHLCTGSLHCTNKFALTLTLYFASNPHAVNMTRHAWRQYSICRDIYISRHSHALDKNDTYILPGFHVNDQLTTTGPLLFSWSPFHLQNCEADG